MKIAVTGSTGLVGTAVSERLRGRGDEIVAASRGRDGPLRWTTDGGFTPLDALSGFDAVLHFAGANISEGRWTEARKRVLRDSRVIGTRSVVQALEAADPRPSVLVAGSAVGAYGDRGDEVLDENAEAGGGFLAELCRDWEAEAIKAEALGVRVVILRTGLVMSTSGGPLAKMLLPFKLGLGGKLGSGRQWMSWIHEDDLVSMILRLLDDATLSGVYNGTAPHPVTNAEFTKTLGLTIRRPTFMPVPGLGLRILFGEMAQDALLTGQRVEPRRMQGQGFTWAYPQLAPALAQLLR
jgi:hypothetical protein